LKIQY